MDRDRRRTEGQSVITHPAQRASPTHAPTPLTEPTYTGPVEDYLKAIYELARAEIEARGGAVIASDAGGAKANFGLLSWLFGGNAGGADDAEEGAGPHVAAARAAETALREATGRSLILNISGAIPAELLDAGFPLAAMKGVPILARTASLVAHLVEEQARAIGFVLSEHAAKGISYDGTVPASFVAQDH